MLYELTAALAISFRVDYDQENGMVTTLEIFATERIYNHKFIINSEYYAITFDYVEPKEKETKTSDVNPEIIDYYFMDEQRNSFRDNLEDYIEQKNMGKYTNSKLNRREFNFRFK